MNLRKIIAAALSLTFVAGATTNMNNYAPINSITVSAQGGTAVTTTTANTTKVVTTTTTAATTTKAAVTTTKTATTTKAKATTSKAATTKVAVTSTTATVTTTAKPVTSITTTSTTTPVANDIIYGDVNNDGRIDAIDASTILAHYALISTNQKGILNEDQIKKADINNDGVVNAIDASTVLAIYAANSVKAIKPSVQNNPIHDFSLEYNIDLSAPTWKGDECDDYVIDSKMDKFRPSEGWLKTLFKGEVLSDYRLVATVYNSKSGYGNVSLEHIFVDNDITELKVEWLDDKKSGLRFLFENNTFRVLSNQNSAREWAFLSGFSGGHTIGASAAIYSNIPIVFEDGTALPLQKEVQLEKLKNVELIDDSGEKSIKIDNYSSCSKTFTVPDWYDIDLRNPAWEGINTETKECCDKFGGDFNMNELFPSKKSLEEGGGLSGYKCVATIVHNSNHGQNAGYRNVELKHIFVKEDVDELKGRWSNKEKTEITFTNLEYVCKNAHTRCSDKEDGWTISNKSIAGLGCAIYTKIPIVLDDGTVIEPYFMYGDINDDGVVDIEDLNLLVSHVNGIKKLEGRALKAADVNRDGVVDKNDITALEEHINGKKPINDSNIITNDNDSDSDGITDLEEYKLGTNRFNPDTDGDGLTDKEEKDKGTDPLNPDTDGDGLSDGIDSDKLTPNIPKGKAPYGQIKFEGEYYRIDVPVKTKIPLFINEQNLSLLEPFYKDELSEINESIHEDISPVIEPKYYVYKSEPFHKFNLDTLGYIAGYELDATNDPHDASQPITGGYTWVKGKGYLKNTESFRNETFHSDTVGMLLLFNNIIDLINGSLSRNDVIFTFEKDSTNTYRKVTILAQSTDIEQMYNKYAGLPPIHASSQVEKRFDFTDENCRKLYKDITEKELAADDGYVYDLVVSVDEKHKGNSNFAYLWLDDEGNIMATPIIYDNDYVKIVRRPEGDILSLFEETVLDVPLSDTINLEQSFVDLFDRIHEYS